MMMKPACITQISDFQSKIFWQLVTYIKPDSKIGIFQYFIINLSSSNDLNKCLGSFKSTYSFSFSFNSPLIYSYLIELLYSGSGYDYG